MPDLHIDEFYQDVARILVSLLRVFPRPVTIYAEDICGPDESDEYGIHSPRHQGCFATLLWLGEEGYVRFNEPIKQEAIDQAVLTGRCFSALIRPVLDQDPDLPTSIRMERASLAHALEQAIREKTTNAVVLHVQSLIADMSQLSPRS